MLGKKAALLEEALEAGKLIERAKGILMKTYGLEEAAAYRLRKQSMDLRQPMSEIAKKVISAVED